MSHPITIIDTGPLVALLNRREKHHAWVVEQLRAISVPLVTCEAVISEAAYLLGQTDHGLSRLAELLRNQAILVAFRFDEEMSPVCDLLAKYSNVPMSFVDACLVRMSETNVRSTVFTLDRDFLIYRQSNGKEIPLLIPHCNTG